MNFRKKMLCETFFSSYCSRKAHYPMEDENQWLKAAIEEILTDFVNHDLKMMPELLNQNAESILSRIKNTDPYRQAIIELWSSYKFSKQISKNDFSQMFNNFYESEKEIEPHYSKAYIKYKNKFPKLINS